MRKGHTHTESEIEQELKESRVSVTMPRKLILKLLKTEHGPFTAEEIHQKLPTGSCDKASVYRTLSLFVEKELVDISHLTKEMAYYEYHDPKHHHHHIICQNCHKIDVFHDCSIDKIERTLEKQGYVNIKHRLEIYATCVACYAKTQSKTSRGPS